MLNKKNNELNNLIEQTKKKEKVKKEQVDINWIIKILIISFVISFGLSFVSEMTIPNLSLVLGIIVTLLFIGLGIVFDIIGVSVTSSDEAVFHSMNSRKVKGASVAVKFKKNADKVSSFCNDVIGDICGIISGSAGVSVARGLASTFNLNIFYTGLIVTALIAALTIGGKALCKRIAIDNNHKIVYMTAKVISKFEKKKK